MGQGTDEITVDTVNLGGQALTATVELSGATPGCNGSASTITEIAVPPIACGLAFDEYGDIKFSDETARLDNFAIQLLNEPLATGYILASAGRETYQNEAKERLKRARSHIVNVRGIDQHRVVTVDCGFTPDLIIKLYVAPPGADAPQCLVFVEIPRSEVKFTKPRPKASNKQR